MKRMGIGNESTMPKSNTLISKAFSQGTPLARLDSKESVSDVHI